MRRGQAGTAQQLQREIWHALRRLGTFVDDPDVEPETLCRLVNALAVASNAYVRLAEHGELADQVQTLWEAHQAQNPGRRAA